MIEVQKVSIHYLFFEIPSLNNTILTSHSLAMPPISRKNRASSGRKALVSRRQFLQQGKILAPATSISRHLGIQCFQRFVDHLSDKEYRVYKKERTRGSLTGLGRLFPVDQKKLNSLFEGARAYELRLQLARSFSFTEKDYSHPLFEYCVKHVTAEC